MIDYLKFKKIFFAFSGFMIFISFSGLLIWGLKLGVEFTGGSSFEYKIEGDVSTEDLKKDIENLGIEVQSVQSSNDKTYIIKTPLLSNEEDEDISMFMEESFGQNFDKLKKENIGPSIGTELVKKTFYAIGIATILILLWVWCQFKSVKYGFSAIFAMLHDTLILVGLFSILGHFWSAEVDFLFVTAVLTTLSFSVHDTIVVFDRIREINKKEGGEIIKVSNMALNETMVRSLNNSFTIIFMLVALILLGGSTIKWFATGLLIGTILGTYSSPFVAVPLLVTWDNLVEKIKRIKIG